MGSKRRSWTSKEKMRIVLAGVSGDIEVSELCRREGISPTQYYTWKNQLNEGAALVFSKVASRPSAKERRLEEELSRAKDVIAEITAENLELKKGV
jgi:transposase